MEYILYVGDDPAAAIRDVPTHELTDEASEGIMTTAEQLLQQGRQEGRQEGLRKGLQKGQLALIEKQIRLKFGAISAHARARLSGASLELIDTWSERILSASTEAELFEG